MLKCLLLSTLFSMTQIAAVAAQDTIGFRLLDLPDPNGVRALNVGVWYPTTDAGPFEVLGETPAFYGVSAVTNAKPLGGVRPLVVLSHGYGGSWRNLSWVAQALVAKGYVVAAPDHPGTTTFNRDPNAAAALWQRPRDVSRVIDALEADATIGGDIDRLRIAAIGHSLGGWTVAELGGAKSEVARYSTDCATLGDSRSCALLAELGVVSANSAALEADLRDPRVKAIVSLDLGLARGFTPESLHSFAVPVLVIGAGIDVGGLPSMRESGSLAGNLPAATTQYITIPDAMHFTFMQICKPNAVALIAEEEPGEEIVCQDPGPRDRATIHREVTDTISAFLAASFSAHP